MNTDYVIFLLSRNDRIYIDTSSVMTVQNFEKFINHYADMFISYQRQIIVPKTVCLELLRHANSANEDKKIKAKKAIQILLTYQELFILEGIMEQGDTIEDGFADSELLSIITRDKMKFTQLLITNDKKLSVDAYQMNRLQSCYGQGIMVCFISDNGELHKGKTTSEKEVSEPLSQTVAIESPVIHQIHPDVKPENMWKKLLLSMSLVGLGFGLGRLTTVTRM